MNQYTDKKVNNTPKAKKLKKRLEELGQVDLKEAYQKMKEE